MYLHVRPVMQTRTPISRTNAPQPTQSVLPFQSGLPNEAARPARHLPRLLDQVRDSLTRRHVSLKAEQAIVYWVKFFISWHGMRHPQELGNREIEAFLLMVRQREDLSPASWSQAANALAFLYRDVLGRTMTTPLPADITTRRSRTARQRISQDLGSWDWFGANQDSAIRTTQSH
jgi:hypothetical protein